MVLQARFKYHFNIGVIHDWENKLICHYLHGKPIKTLKKVIMQMLLTSQMSLRCIVVLRDILAVQMMDSSMYVLARKPIEKKSKTFAHN